MVDLLLLWLIIHSSFDGYLVHHRLFIHVIRNLVTLSHPSRHNVIHNSQVLFINLVVIDNQLKDVDDFPLLATCSPLSSHWSSGP